MKQQDNAAVYRICAISDERWDVLRDSSPEPVATFADKHAALAYAMSLARARSSWQLPLGQHRGCPKSMFAEQPRGTRGARL